MTANKGTKKHIIAEFQCCSRSRKVESSVKGTYISCSVSSKGQISNTLISSDTTGGLLFPPLAPMDLKYPPTHSASLEWEQDEGVLESGAKRTQVSISLVSLLSIHATLRQSMS